MQKYWTEPLVLKAHTGLTACKYMNKTHKAINEFISKNRYIKHMGLVGHWRQEDVDRLVLPTSGGMIMDEVDEMDDILAEVEVRAEITNEVNE